MKRFGVIGAALLLLSGCAANDTAPPSNLEGAVSEAPAANASAPAVTDGQLHTLSVELMTYQGGTNGAREYVVAQVFPYQALCIRGEQGQHCTFS